MMGKRVNYAARSVISPDPRLLPREVGIPPYFAVRLSVPERVTEANARELRRAVRNGARQHPGALAVEDEQGRVVSLIGLPAAKRDALARSLLAKKSSAVVIGKGGGRLLLLRRRRQRLLLLLLQPTARPPPLLPAPPLLLQLPPSTRRPAPRSSTATSSTATSSSPTASRLSTARGSSPTARAC